MREPGYELSLGVNEHARGRGPPPAVSEGENVTVRKVRE